jgi:hypothetical protein
VGKSKRGRQLNEHAVLANSESECDICQPLQVTVNIVPHVVRMLHMDGIKLRQALSTRFAPTEHLLAMEVLEPMFYTRTPRPTMEQCLEKVKVRQNAGCALPAPA